MGEFVTYLLRTEHMLIMLSVSVGISTVGRLAPSVADNANWARALPILPIVLCSAMVWLPGLVGGQLWEKLLLGLVLGSFSASANKILRQSIFGHDKRISRDRARL